MQTPTPMGSSRTAHAALVTLATDLRVHPVVLARALTYAWDNQSYFASAGQAVCFGLARQSHGVDERNMETSLQKLRRDFGGMLDMAGVGMRC